MLILFLITDGKMPLFSVPARLVETQAEKELPWPSRPQRIGSSFSPEEAVGVGTGSTVEIQPLWALGLWAYLGSGVGGEKNEGLWSQISCHLHTV